MRIRDKNRRAYEAMDKEFLEFARAYLSEGFPNQDREGCPPESALRSLAFNPRESDATVTEHLAACSPCFKRYSELLAELKAQQEAQKSGWPRAYAWSQAHPMLAVTALVSALFLAIGVGFLLRGIRQPNVPRETHKERRPLESQVPPVAYIPFSLDLSALSRERGGEAEPSQPRRIAVPSSALDLTLTLPLGTQEGPYDLKLSTGGRIVWSNSALAYLQEGTTLIRVEADFSQVPEGDYDLEVQSSGGNRLVQPLSIQAPLSDGGELMP